MSWEDYGKLFDQLLPDVVRGARPAARLLAVQPAHARRRPRRTSTTRRAATRTCGTSGTAASPSSGTAPASTASTASSASSRFPEPRTVDGYTAPAGPQRDQLRHGAPPAQRHRQHAIMQYMLDWFRLPTRFDDDPVAEPDPAGHGDEVRRRALAAHHAARHGHAVLAAQRLLAGGELGVASTTTAAGRPCTTWPAGSTRRCWSAASRTSSAARSRCTSPATWWRPPAARVSWRVTTVAGESVASGGTG